MRVVTQEIVAALPAVIELKASGGPRTADARVDAAQSTCRNTIKPRTKSRR